MKRAQQGFTLIELVMVIVILGVLAAVAVPKFVDLGAQARNAGVQGVAGGISSASSVNFAARSANAANGSPTTGVSCAVAAARILEGGMPAGYEFTAGPAALVAGANTCTVNSTPTAATAQNATIIGIN